ESSHRSLPTGYVFVLQKFNDGTMNARMSSGGATMPSELARWVVRHTRYLARSFKFVGSPTLRSDDSENQSTSRAALTLRVRRFSFFPSRQGSSVVEQGTHKPLVGSSTLPPGIFAACFMN